MIIKYVFVLSETVFDITIIKCLKIHKEYSVIIKNYFYYFIKI